MSSPSPPKKLKKIKAPSSPRTPRSSKYEKRVHGKESLNQQFYRMVRNNQTKSIKPFLQEHPSLVNAELRGPWTSVPLAARYGHWKLAQQLYEQGGYFFPLGAKPIMEGLLSGGPSSPA